MGKLEEKMETGKKETLKKGTGKEIGNWNQRKRGEGGNNVGLVTTLVYYLLIVALVPEEVVDVAERLRHDGALGGRPGRVEVEFEM